MRESPAHNTDQAVIVALGSNLPGDYGSTQALLEAAVAALEAGGFKVLRRSRWWRSAAWPDPSGPEYLNGVVVVETALDVEDALDALHAIEDDFGRARGAANLARTLDLDLIAHGRVVLFDEAVVVPHPRAASRLFVMGPLSEVAPMWRHPVLQLTAVELATRATVGSDARPLS